VRRWAVSTRSHVRRQCTTTSDCSCQLHVHLPARLHRTALRVRYTIHSPSVTDSHARRHTIHYARAHLNEVIYSVGVVRWPAAGDTAGSSLRRLSSLQRRIYNLLGAPALNKLHYCILSHIEHRTPAIVHDKTHYILIEIQPNETFLKTHCSFIIADCGL